MSEKLVRMKQVLELVPVHRSTIYAWSQAGKFPKSIQLGPATVAWRESDVLDFCNGDWKPEVDGGTGHA